MVDKILFSDLNTILNSNSVVFDIGANNGNFSKKLIDLINPEKLYLFEPLPDRYSELYKLSLKFPQIVFINKCVSTLNGLVNFNITECDTGSSILQPIENKKINWLKNSKQIQIESIRLDDFITTYDIPFIDLIKIDTQGTDLDVLKSLGSHLNSNRIKNVLVELCFSDFYNGQNKYHEILKYLDLKGYKFVQFYPHYNSEGWVWWADALFIFKVTNSKGTF